jgi:hypothetical protein
MKKALHLIRSSPYIISNNFWKHLKEDIKLLVEKKNIQSMVLLPRSAARFMGVNKSNTDVVDTCIALGIVGWMVWTSLDRIRDIEKSECDELATASVLRPIIEELLQSLSLSKNDMSYIYQKIGLMEYANSSYCKLSTHERSVYKSIGVEIPLLVFLIRENITIDNIVLCEKYFYHFITARQLSDDGFDWKEDMKKGHRTLVIDQLEDIGGTHASMKEYQKIFKETVSLKITRIILRHAQASMKYARQMDCFTSTEFLEELPRQYEHIAQKALLTYKK